MDLKVQVIDLGFVNAFLVQTGDGYVLVDSGVGPQWAQLERELVKAGCVPGKLRLVLVTHGDFDHTGNCARLQKKYQAKVAMHPGDAAMVRTGVAPDRQTRGWLAQLMVLAGKVLSLSGGFETFEPDIWLEDGQGLEAYGLAARVFHTPGHTPGSIAVLTEQGHLFPGDTVSNRRRPGPAPFVDNAEQLRASVAALRAMPAQMVYPGHGKPFAAEALADVEM